MAIKRRDFQKLSSTVQEFLLKLPDEESSARLRDNLLHALHFLQLYYRILQNRDRNTDTLQWTIDHSLSPLTPFREAPDKFEWEWLNVESQKVRQSLPKQSIENFKTLPQIICAIKDGDLDFVIELVQKEPSSVNCTDLFTRDCVTYAIQFDQIEILKYLLKNGANTNNIASDSSTSLHRAVYKSNPEAVELLLEFKANINAQDCYNRAPLHWSVVNKHIDCLKVLLKYNPNINIKDKDGMSPSMWACHLDHIEHFKLINKLENNVNLNKKIDLNNMERDNDGRTWLHWSVRKNEPLQCLNFLINSETVLLRDKEGKTCLHVAAEQGSIQACKLILEIAGSNVIINEKDNKKQTPLHLSTLNGHARGIKILMDNGADPNIKDLTGASPIDYVTKRGLFFCSSIIEVCIRNLERRSRASSNSVASSLNGSESNITPAPPTTPITNAYSRSFLGRPPRPVNMSSTSVGESFKTSTEFNKTAPANLNGLNQSHSDDLTNNHNNISIPPSPPTIAKTRPNLRGGWNSTERILSGSLRLSRASTRTSFASEDLDKYMSNGNNMNENYGGSLNNIDNLSNNITNVNSSKPLAPPRLASSNSTNRIYSGRLQDTPMSTGSFDGQSSVQAPPPIKPRKSSSVASLNNSNLENQSFINKHMNMNSNNLNKSLPIQKNTNHLNVEDISGDELSIASVKGEGFASDLSDSEVKTSHQVVQKQRVNKKSAEHNPKRPTTPMDFRQADNNQPIQLKNTRPQLHHQPQNVQQSSIKFQHIGDISIQGPTRFNEWDPYASIRQQQQQQHQQLNDRQKSPLKKKNQSNFAQSFLNTDSSPRQSSGRVQVGSAVQKLQQLSPQIQQQQSQFLLNSNQIDLNNSGNFDLIISGQKLGSRKDSPTNTPRDHNQPQQQQQIQPTNSQQQSQQSQRSYARRLQPIDKNSADILNTSIESQFVRQKTSKTGIDRKKLEPIRGHGNFNNINNTLSTSHVETISTGHSITEVDGVGNDEEPSISENTLSSDKQQSQIINNIKVKKSGFNRNRKKFIEPILGNDEALKM